MTNSTPATEAPASTSYVFGYRRVSSVQQSYERQTAALLDHGIDPENVYEDKLSGKTMDRPGFLALKKATRKGDTVVVSSLDRLGRTTLHVLQTLEELEDKGVTVRSLKPGEDFTGVTGTLIRNIMASLAQWEREMINERAADARAARKAAGTTKGRARTATSVDKVSQIRALRAGGLTVPQIVEATGVSRASVFRALKD